MPMGIRVNALGSSTCRSTLMRIRPLPITRSGLAPGQTRGSGRDIDRVRDLGPGDSSVATMPARAPGRSGQCSPETEVPYAVYVPAGPAGLSGGEAASCDRQGPY